jgi:hypothetical protein
VHGAQRTGPARVPAPRRPSPRRSSRGGLPDHAYHPLVHALLRSADVLEPESRPGHRASERAMRDRESCRRLKHPAPAHDLNPDVAAESLEKFDGLRVPLPQGEVARSLRIGLVQISSAMNLPDTAQRSAALTYASSRVAGLLSPGPLRYLPGEPSCAHSGQAQRARCCAAVPGRTGPCRRTNGYGRDHGFHPGAWPARSRARTDFPSPQLPAPTRTGRYSQVSGQRYLTCTSPGP